MKHNLFPILCSVLLFAGSSAMPVSAAELVAIKGATLVEADLNDGDSFKVIAGGRELHLRLYYVDCMETTYAHKADQERILEQQDHFGLTEPHAVVRFGRRAAEYVHQALSRPFTVHTSYAKALGRSATGRVYAFVETHDGHDLGRLLVERGLARIYGKTRPSPGGLPSDLVLDELGDLRAKAMLKRAGIWAEADPDIIVERRTYKRKEELARKAFRKKLKQQDAPSTTKPMDLNSVSQKQLELIPGIGPVTATKIVAGRPWRSVEDLLNVSGIGPKTLERIAPYVMVGERDGSR